MIRISHAILQLQNYTHNTGDRDSTNSGKRCKSYILLNIYEILGGQRHLCPLHLKFWRESSPAVPLKSPLLVLMISSVVPENVQQMDRKVTDAEHPDDSDQHLGDVPSSRHLRGYVVRSSSS